MNDLNITQIEQKAQSKIQPSSLNWADSPSAKKLLDVIAAIIAEEYIEVAKKNRGVFKIASPRQKYGGACNDAENGGAKCE